MARLRGAHYYSAPYLSPFYSPCMGEQCVAGSADFGRPFVFWPFSPALIILIVPLGFRMTCYYYRKAYYRSSGCRHPRAEWPSRTRSTAVSAGSR